MSTACALLEVSVFRSPKHYADWVSAVRQRAVPSISDWQLRIKQVAQTFATGSHVDNASAENSVIKTLELLNYAYCLVAEVIKGNVIGISASNLNSDQMKNGHSGAANFVGFDAERVEYLTRGAAGRVISLVL